MVRRASISSVRRERRGAVILEFILGFLILVLLTFGLVELAILSIIDQTVRTAAIEGVRESAKGATTDQVKNRIDEILGIHDIDGLNAATPDVRLLIEDDTTTVDEGNAAIPCVSTGLNPVATGNVRVTVCLFVSGPVPDLLQTLGFSLENRVFNSSAEAQKE